MQKSFGRSLVAFIGGIIGIIYILNPGAGVIELIPDAFPVIGNLDEAAAIVLVLTAMRYFGFDLTKFFTGDKIDKKK